MIAVMSGKLNSTNTEDSKFLKTEVLENTTTKTAKAILTWTMQR